MLEYKEVETSREVIASICIKHDKELVVFSSYSNPTGTCRMGNGQPQMDTWWGFKNSDCPLYHSRTTWENGEIPYKRYNERFQVWLCLPIEPEEGRRGDNMQEFRKILSQIDALKDELSCLDQAQTFVRVEVDMLERKLRSMLWEKINGRGAK